MIYLPLSHLHPGMTLARDVDHDIGLLPLVVPGQKLTPAIITRLRELGISGAYIESSFSQDIVVEEFIEPKLKREVVCELKKLSKDYISHVPISTNMVKSMRNLAQKLLDFIFTKNECLLNVIEIRNYDTYTYSHSIYVAILGVFIGMQLGLPYSALTEIAMAGFLHDFGKLDIPIEITNKPSPLTAKEFEQMKQHPVKAIEHLKASTLISFSVLSGIKSHHEKYDGTGYPDHLIGNSIPLYGRIIAVADVYDALTTSRPYRRAWYPNEAIEYMMGSADTHFDMKILKAFLKTVAAYPVGTIVKLSNGYMSLVIKNSSENVLRPVVRILLPESHSGEIIYMADDPTYLNVTIVSIVSDETKLPNFLFK